MIEAAGLPGSAREGADADIAVRPLRIALLTHSVNPRGGVVHTLELAEALRRAGHAVTVFAPATPGERLFRASSARVELLPHADPPGPLVQRVAARIASYEAGLSALWHGGAPAAPFDVWHAQDSVSGNALAHLRERGLIDGFVRTVHHLDDFDDARLRAWQDRGFRAATLRLCVSRLWCERLRREQGVDAQPVSNGVDLRRFRPQPGEADAAIAARLGLGMAGTPAALAGAHRDGPRWLAIGGVEERKNTVRALQAFARFRTRHPRAQLVIAGGASLLDHGAYAAQFEQALRDAGLARGRHQPVVLTGPLADADLPALYRQCDGLLMPSLREGFGLVVLEALACGRPVVVSAMPPFTEYLAADESTGEAFWADPLDPDSICAAMQRALAAPMRRETPAVCRRLSWDASARRHVDLYRAHSAPTISAVVWPETASAGSLRLAATGGAAPGPGVFLSEAA